MSKKIKVGVFGAFRGKTMVKVMARHPDAELVAICDKYEPALRYCEKLAEEAGTRVTCYTDFDQFFQHDMDAVVLANYANEHAPYAIKLLKSGRHVISEVLPVETMAQAVELVEAVEESGKVYTYAENYCYFAATQEMKRIYRSGDLGEFMHGEGEYVHYIDKDETAKLTYGDRNHWRNRTFSSYYCTHSLGPILTITGNRPVRVVAFETPNTKADTGRPTGTSAMILVQMDNGATVKSLHGGLNRHPLSVWYSIYGTDGMMESDRWHEGTERINVYKRGLNLTESEISYRPNPKVDTRLSRLITSHGGGDFYTMHYFLEKILGRPAGEESIDVYQALDMAFPGILGYKSICNGNKPYTVPDFRDKVVREQYRNDNFCTTPELAGDQLAPFCSFGTPDIPDSTYEEMHKLWIEQEARKDRWDLS